MAAKLKPEQIKYFYKRQVWDQFPVRVQEVFIKRWPAQFCYHGLPIDDSLNMEHYYSQCLLCYHARQLHQRIANSSTVVTL